MKKPRRLRYLYSTVMFRDSLLSPSFAIPLAVIVSAPKGRMGAFGLDVRIDNPGDGEISARILENSKDIILGQLDEAKSKGLRGKKLFDYLAEQNKWSFFLTPPKTKETTEDLFEFAAKELTTQMAPLVMAQFVKAVRGNVPPPAPLRLNLISVDNYNKQMVAA